MAEAKIIGFQRVADAEACEFCQAVDGAFLKSEDPMPLHNGCGCGVEPILSDDPRAKQVKKAPPGGIPRPAFVPPHGANQIETAMLLNRQRDRFERLPDDAVVEVYHGAGGATGTGDKAVTYVTANIQQARGYALGQDPMVLRVRKAQLQESPETKAAGFTDMTDGLFGAGEAVIPREQIPFPQVNEHGELGPVLTDPAHDFTGPSDL